MTIDINYAGAAGSILPVLSMQHFCIDTASCHAVLMLLSFIFMFYDHFSLLILSIYFSFIFTVE